MPDRLVLDYDAMLAPRLGRGIEPADIAALATRFSDIHEAVQHRYNAGALAFLDLPAGGEVVEQIRTFAEGMGQAFDTIVVLGIGGSALGTIALRQALLRTGWNEAEAEAREFFPRLFVLDNVDPTTIAPLLDRLDLARTLFNVVSKSGSTAETLAQFLIVQQRLRAALGDEGWRGHFLFTTDPSSGPLRAIAEQDGIASLPVPPGVGGRFSVLSAVGLLPAALVGIDIDALLAGAAAMVQRCASAALHENPAGMFAALQYHAHERAGAPIHVMMPYTDRLAGVADWFRQLWAESLGKRVDTSGAVVHRGPTPVVALGATDQHSQVQLYMEGPFDKTITFLTVRSLPADLVIPHAFPDLDALAFLGGHSLGGLLEAERAATRSALTRAGRMNMTIQLPDIGAHSIGQLLMLLQLATVYAGGFYDVDPLDQPGVELGKRLTYGLLGRPGYEAPDDPAPDSRHVST
jgi:glucose-6-phosphate isomerase